MKMTGVLVKMPVRRAHDGMVHYTIRLPPIRWRVRGESYQCTYRTQITDCLHRKTGMCTLQAGCKKAVC